MLKVTTAARSSSGLHNRPCCWQDHRYSKAFHKLTAYSLGVLSGRSRGMGLGESREDVGRLGLGECDDTESTTPILGRSNDHTLEGIQKV